MRGKGEYDILILATVQADLLFTTRHRHFYDATFFLWYPNLIVCYMNMSYFWMIWTFAFGKCYGRGALNRFLVVLILVETRAVLIMKVSPGVNISMRWVFNFCLFWIFFCSHGTNVLDVKSWGGS